MPYVNLPPDLQRYFQTLSDRITRLEMAQRFTAPNVDFSVDTPTNPRTGDLYYDTTPNAEMLKYWDVNQWVEIADNRYGTSVIPVTNATLQTVNNNMVYTGQPLTIYYQRIGKMITAQTMIDCTNITNFGTGQWKITMPAGFVAPLLDAVAGGYIRQAGTTYTIFSTIAAGSTTFYLWHPTSNGGSDPVTYNKPVVLTTSSTIGVTGVALLP